MPRQSVAGSCYPADWIEIARKIKDECGWTCVRCSHPHDRESGHILTIHHADLNPSNSAWWNLLPLCQRCHLRFQGRVILERPWVLEHSDWFKPYVAGYYAKRYLDQDLTREDVIARLDELLELERQAVLA